MDSNQEKDNQAPADAGANGAGDQSHTTPQPAAAEAATGDHINIKVKSQVSIHPMTQKRPIISDFWPLLLPPF